MILRFRKHILFGDTGVRENYKFLRKEREMKSEHFIEEVRLELNL